MLILNCLGYKANTNGMDLNTSNVDIKHLLLWLVIVLYADLNTSNVDIKPTGAPTDWAGTVYLNTSNVDIKHFKTSI